jgi:hypothetical protein
MGSVLRLTFVLAVLDIMGINVKILSVMESPHQTPRFAQEMDNVFNLTIAIVIKDIIL